MNREQIHSIARALFNALVECKSIPPLTDTYPNMSISDAYEIQRVMVGKRVDSRGESVVGKKIGITSQAVMDMLGVHQPDFGQLTSGMQYSNGAHVPLSQFIAPRAEGEIAFRLAKDLVGPGITPNDVLDATEYILPCFEIVDSRIRDWKIRIHDTVSDNASSGAFVLGVGGVDPRKIDLASVEMRVTCNGEEVGRGNGSAALGHPLNTVVWLANQLGELGSSLKAGEIILSGALSAMIPAKRGDRMSVEISDIGRADVVFE